MTRSNLTNLAADAYRHGEATASNGRWRAHRTDHDSVIVGHYATAMIEIHYNHGMADRVEALDAGWGSMTDKTGIGQIVRAEKVAASYADVFATTLCRQGCGEPVATPKGDCAICAGYTD